MRKIFLLFSFAFLLASVTGCAPEGGTDAADALCLQDFGLYLEEGGDDSPDIKAASIQISDLVRDAFGSSLSTVSDPPAGDGQDAPTQPTLSLSCDAAAAARLGEDLEGLPKHAFVLLRQDANLYLLSPQPKGLVRAASYLIQHFTAKDGALLLGDGERYSDLGTNVKDAVLIGEEPIEEYAITYSDKSLLPLCRELQYYIAQTAGAYVPIAKVTLKPSIRLVLDKKATEGELTVKDGKVTLASSDLSTLSAQVHLFLDAYLGWIKTGTPLAHLSNAASTIHVPAQVEETPDPWIAQREAIIVLWNVNFTRGSYLNSNISLKNNVIDFSEDQLYEYVKMLRFCGFTGIQVTEMCSTWAGVGGYGPAHAQIRILSEAAHSLGMKFTLWVWGSEFSDCGWVDPTVTYTFGDQGYSYAYENPDLVATFEKYYDIYAQLADCCDRVIGHYYDPGNLHQAEDIAYFAKMLKDKFLAVNPQIDFGISCWVDIYDKNIFIDALGNDVTLYENGRHDSEEEYIAFRNEVNSLGARLGTWSWNNCEMEIDQLAQMNYNLDLIRSVYQTARRYDEIKKPDYWSEMDSYHLLNVFSLYCAGQMLINPDMASDDLTMGIATAAVGPDYAPVFADLLNLIQDARSGHSYETFFWSKDDYILKSASYPAEDILARLDKDLPVFYEMMESGLESYTLPLPISLSDLLGMMLSHLKQIQSYAQFRVGLAKLEEDFAQGAAQGGADAQDTAQGGGNAGDAFLDDIQARLYGLAKPIEEYDCIIGAWGQIEARAQYEMVTEFCQRTGLTVPYYPDFQEKRKDYILAQLICYQKDYKDAYLLEEPYYQLGLAYGPQETNRLVEELVQEGSLVRVDEKTVRLKDWERYTWNFR